MTLENTSCFYIIWSKVLFWYIMNVSFMHLGALSIYMSLMKIPGTF